MRVAQDEVHKVPYVSLLSIERTLEPYTHYFH